MATEILATLQGTAETRTHFVDFTNDLPSAVTVASATATHTPPTGGTVTPSVGVIASNVVPVTVPPLTQTGRHIVTVNATLSNGDIVTARLVIPVQWDVARATMSHLIAELRGMTDAGSKDYTIGGMPYWTDKQLQTVLDANKCYVNYAQFGGLSNIGPGVTYTYTLYPTGRAWWEDTVVVQDLSGGTIGTANYSMDLLTGMVTFTANQSGSLRYVTGNTYDLHASAADVWTKKAAHYAVAYDFSTDNHSMKRSQLIIQCKDMARTYRELAQAGMSITLDRTDGVNGY
jgi:hypothetical protein